MSTGKRKRKIRSIFQVSSSAFRQIWHGINMKSQKDRKGISNNNMIFYGSNENFIQNGRRLLEESISLFQGHINPYRCLSVDELNAIKIDVNNTSYILHEESYAKWHIGVWDGRYVLVKEFFDRFESLRYGMIREIVVAIQMSTHRNVHKLIGCCLETKYPVLIYEWVEKGSLEDWILRGKNQDKSQLEWKDRLRIAWEIAHAVSYLHTAFRRPIIHRNLKPVHVLLDQDNTAKLSEFTSAISVPEGEEYVEDNIVGTFGYLAPEYFRSSRVAESADVYSFGVLFLVLLTGKAAVFIPTGDDLATHLVDWVMKGVTSTKVGEIIDPAIAFNGSISNADLQHQLSASVELALRCTATEEKTRPAMIDVATELKSMIKSSESVLSNHQ